jgi:hypothetical protein
LSPPHFSHSHTHTHTPHHLKPGRPPARVLCGHPGHRAGPGGGALREKGAGGWRESEAVHGFHSVWSRLCGFFSEGGVRDDCACACVCVRVCVCDFILCVCVGGCKWTERRGVFFSHERGGWISPATPEEKRGERENDGFLPQHPVPHLDLPPFPPTLPHSPAGRLICLAEGGRQFPDSWARRERDERRARVIAAACPADLASSFFLRAFTKHHQPTMASDEEAIKLHAAGLGDEGASALEREGGGWWGRGWGWRGREEVALEPGLRRALGPTPRRPAPVTGAKSRLRPSHSVEWPFFSARVCVPHSTDAAPSHPGSFARPNLSHFFFFFFPFPSPIHHLQPPPPACRTWRPCAP